MNSAVTTSPSVNVDKIQELLATGNLAQFTSQERVAYINKVCELTGLNPLTRPFEFITFQGKMVMYAGKGCADQLRKIHRVSIIDITQTIVSDILCVSVKGQDHTGRIDSEVGALNIAGLKGEALANATMKCITKAKRRLTLSMVGLGILDELEVESVSAPHMPQADSKVLPPSSQDFKELRELLKKYEKTEQGLLDYISAQSGEIVEKIENFNSAQLQSAFRMLGVNK